MVCSIYFSSEWSECRGPRYPSGLASGDPSGTVVFSAYPGQVEILSVLDNMGQEQIAINEQGRETIDVSNLSAGVYFLKTRLINQIQTTPFLKQ